MEYIRAFYSVPAQIGGRVRLFDGTEGVIVGADEGRLLIECDSVIGHYHPTWQIEYLF